MSNFDIYNSRSASRLGVLALLNLGVLAETPIFILRANLCFLHSDFLEKYNRKITNVTMNDRKFLQAVLPAAKGDLGVSSARLLALPYQLF